MAQIRTLRIIQHNVRNWSTNKIQLLNTYSNLDADIILLNSHSQTNEQSIKIFNYTVYQSNKSGEINDGVAIAIKNNIKHRIIDNFTSECLAIKVITTQGEIIIATSYLPPRRPFLPANDIINLMNYTQPTYILGDFNARHHIFGNKNTNNVGKSLDTLIRAGRLKYLGPDFYTYLGHRTTSTPEKIFTNNKAFLNYYIQPGPITTSDHIPIIFTVSTSPIQIETKRRFTMSKANWEGFKQDLIQHQIPNLDLSQLEDIDRELKKVTTAIKYAATKNIPYSSYRTIPHNKPTEYIRQLQTQYCNLRTYIERYGANLDIMRRIKAIQIKLRQECQRISKEKWDELINNLDTNKNPKDFWISIKKMIGNDKQILTFIKDQNGIPLYTDKEIESAFRREWKNVFRISDEENDEFDEDHELIIKEWMETRLDRTFPSEITDLSKIRESGEITEGELFHNLRTFKEKTPGFSGITRNMLLNSPTNIINSLINIFNASLSSGYFPDAFKISKIIFIPKAGKDQSQIINYRPISLLEIIGKLFEKIINKRLQAFLETRNLINPRQHGFRKNRGTHTALAIITEILSKAKSRGDQVNVVLRDVSKAFDKVWHLGLKYKILQLGLPTFMEQILCDYLQDRYARININTDIGPKFNLLSGVPQGGCLSPTLYSIFTSDLPAPTAFSEHILFADDITQIVMYPGKSKEMAARCTQTAIESINKYEKLWKIKTNTRKFKVIPIGKQRTNKLEIEGNEIEYSTGGQILGLKITKGGYAQFIKEKKQNLNHTLSKLSRFSEATSTTKRKLYMALIRSTLTYPPIPLVTAKPTNMNKLQVIQNKSLRFIYNIRYPNIVNNKELHDRANLPPVNVLLYDLAKNIWDKIDIMDISSQRELINIENNIIVTNSATYPSSKQLMLLPPPQPIFRY